MDAEHIKHNIDRIESVLDEARVVWKQGGKVPGELRLSIELMHQQARQVKHRSWFDEVAVRQTSLQLAEEADRAMQACRNAGAELDARLRQALQKVHEHLSSLKHQLAASTV